MKRSRIFVLSLLILLPLNVTGNNNETDVSPFLRFPLGIFSETAAGSTLSVGEQVYLFKGLSAQGLRELAKLVSDTQLIYSSAVLLPSFIIFAAGTLSRSYPETTPAARNLSLLALWGQSGYFFLDAMLRGMLLASQSASYGESLSQWYQRWQCGAKTGSYPVYILQPDLAAQFHFQVETFPGLTARLKITRLSRTPQSIDSHWRKLAEAFEYQHIDTLTLSFEESDQQTYLQLLLESTRQEARQEVRQEARVALAIAITESYFPWDLQLMENWCGLTGQDTVYSVFNPEFIRNLAHALTDPGEPLPPPEPVCVNDSSLLKSDSAALLTFPEGKLVWSDQGSGLNHPGFLALGQLPLPPEEILALASAEDALSLFRNLSSQSVWTQEQLLALGWRSGNELMGILSPVVNRLMVTASLEAALPPASGQERIQVKANHDDSHRAGFSMVEFFRPAHNQLISGDYKRPAGSAELLSIRNYGLPLLSPLYMMNPSDSTRKRASSGQKSSGEREAAKVQGLAGFLGNFFGYGSSQDPSSPEPQASSRKRGRVDQSPESSEPQASSSKRGRVDQSPESPEPEVRKKELDVSEFYRPESYLQSVDDLVQSIQEELASGDDRLAEVDRLAKLAKGTMGETMTGSLGSAKYFAVRDEETPRLAQGELDEQSFTKEIKLINGRTRRIQGQQVVAIPAIYHKVDQPGGASQCMESTAAIENAVRRQVMPERRKLAGLAVLSQPSMFRETFQKDIEASHASLDQWLSEQQARQEPPAPRERRRKKGQGLPPNGERAMKEHLDQLIVLANSELMRPNPGKYLLRIRERDWQFHIEKFEGLYSNARGIQRTKVAASLREYYAISTSWSLNLPPEPDTAAEGWIIPLRSDLRAEVRQPITTAWTQEPADGLSAEDMKKIKTLLDDLYTFASAPQKTELLEEAEGNYHRRVFERLYARATREQQEKLELPVEAYHQLPGCIKLNLKRADPRLFRNY